MERIVILDMGSQYCHLLARRIRQLGVYSEILESDALPESIFGAKGIILSGGPASVYEKGSPQCNKEIFKMNIPILGLCYGHQLLAQYLGGKVKQGNVKEYGIAKLAVKENQGLFKGLSRSEAVWMSHGDQVVYLPRDFSIIGTTTDCEITAMANYDEKYFGLQFHPEVTHTVNGMKILENFVDICDCNRDYVLKDYFSVISKEIKDGIKGRKVFLLVSGGVDSTVCFALLEKIIGADNVYGLFIDNGFVRLNEVNEVKNALKSYGFKHFDVYDASDEFLSCVKSLSEPEDKRKIIGETFIRVQEKAMKKLGLNSNEWVLAQGTIYPDTIETKGTKNADLIKTHHNRVEIVQKMIDQGKVIEPLKSFYKDEVRALGKLIGLPDKFIFRHPFPGPGLSVRCLCSKGDEIIKNEADINKEIDKVVSRYKLKGKVIPVKSVGVQGDARSYKHPVVIWGKADWDLLEEVSTNITNKIKEINRVIYCFEKDVNEVKLKQAYLTKDRLDVLRKADSIVMDFIRENSIYYDIWQFPVILIPFGNKFFESLILRPITSSEAMTARFYRMEFKLIANLIKRLQEIKGIDIIFYDVTNKPPATIEWE